MHGRLRVVLLLIATVAAPATIGCSGSGPDSVKPTVEVPQGYKEKGSKNLAAPLGEAGAAPTGTTKAARRR